MNFSIYRELILGRFFLSGVTYLLTFGMASIVGAESYGEVAFYIYLVKSIPLFTFGLAQGVIYKEYADNGITIRSYALTYALICFFVLLVYGSVHGLVMVLVAIPFCFIHVVEPFLKTRKDFLAVLYVELLCSLSFLLVWSSFGEIKSTESLSSLFLISTIFVFLFFVSRYKLLSDFKNKVMSYKFSLYYVKELVVRGFGSYLFNFAYFSFLFLDRTFVNEYYSSDEFGSVMLAFQLSLVAGFIPVAINSRALIDLGDELKKSGTIQSVHLTKRLSSMVLINSLFVLVFLFLYFLFGDFFFPGYKNIENYLIIFGASIVAFNSYGSISPVIFYMKKQVFPAVFMLASVLFMSVFHLYAKDIGLPLLLVELINYTMLSIVCVLCVFYVFSVVRKERACIF